MEQLDSGVLVVWTDVIAEHETEFNAWYDEQHLPERVAVPGFRNGRRFVATPSPKYFAFYETHAPEVMACAPYRERLANPTEWTQRVMPWFVGTQRAACRVIASIGAGIGGCVQTITFSMPMPEEPRPDWLLEQALPAAASHLGCVRVQLLHSDPTLTNQPNPEQVFRQQRDTAPDCIVIIEAAAEQALAEIVAPLAATLKERGVSDVAVQGPYQLLNFLRKE